MVNLNEEFTGESMITGRIRQRSYFRLSLSTVIFVNCPLDNCPRFLYSHQVYILKHTYQGNMTDLLISMIWNKPVSINHKYTVHIGINKFNTLWWSCKNDSYFCNCGLKFRWTVLPCMLCTWGHLSSIYHICVIQLRLFLLLLCVLCSWGHFSFYLCCVPEDISPPSTIFVWYCWGYFSSCLWYVKEDITFILFVLCSLGDF